MRAFVLVDLGFGDAGKGLLTDHLVRRTHAGVVVRYNGGAQAGHNVVAPDGRHHTFSQFGAGTFVPGVRTFLSHHVVIHPAALLAEGDLLRSRGVSDAFARLRLSEAALVITPFHQAANRIRELARRAARHGSCGVGIGETVEHAQAHPDERLLAADLARPQALRRKARRIQERLHAELAPLCRAAPPASALAAEFSLLASPEVVDDWLESIARIPALGLIAGEELLARWLCQEKDVIFEGAQGVLLDADAGFHPHTTWSRCTAANALELLAALAPAAEPLRLGILRACAVRHGAGPLPSETAELAAVIHEHNRRGKWQGAVRYGWFDALLARYALRVNGGVDLLALTHLDAPPRLGRWQICSGYRPADAFARTAARLRLAQDVIVDLDLPHDLPLAARAAFTSALAAVTPVLQPCPPQEPAVLAAVAAALERPVDIVSRGPSAADVALLHPLPGDPPQP